MHIDLIGRVRNTKLAAGHGLMPLFEAIINSVHAVSESGADDGLITVTIKRGEALLADDAHGNTLADIIAFEVRDNGVGFTTTNFDSFETLDSRAKAEVGGKGVGRLLWLKAFARVAVSSTYTEGGNWWKREFDFVLTPAGIENHSVRQNEATARATSVRLLDFAERYRAASPKSAEAIGRRIVEHCLEHYLLGTMPRVVVSDASEGNTQLDLSELFQREFRPHSTAREFSVDEQSFTLTDIFLRSQGEPDHRVHYCAHRRVVTSQRLNGVIPHLDGPLRGDDGEDVVYWGCVTGDLLDARVDSERISFDIDREGELGLTGGPVWGRIEAAANAAIAELLGPKTEEAKRASFDRIRSFIEGEPRYRPLLGHRQAELEALPGNLSDDKLDLELHRLMASWRQEVRSAVSRRLADLPQESEIYEEHRSEYVRLLGELQEVAKSDLADYVVNRATVLSFFDKMLRGLESGKFRREESLHELFFPRRTTSDNVDFEKHNLWILDERLAYHHYLSSDVAFGSQTNAPVSVPSGQRPDILIYNGPVVYNSPLAFTPGDPPHPSVVIVEFKRPERDDYTDEDNPIRQVLDYVQLIRDGKARRMDGSSIDPLPAETPFYCYVVATLTPKLRTEALHRGFTEAPDRLGFFAFNPNYRAYIEVSSYRKVLDDARKRNKAFFDQLQIKVG